MEFCASPIIFRNQNLYSQADKHANNAYKRLAWGGGTKAWNVTEKENITKIKKIITEDHLGCVWDLCGF
jgi:hypothetical protein